MEKELKLNLFKIIGSIFFLLLSILIQNTYLKISLYIISYIIISYEMYINVFHNLKKKELFDENFLMIIATLGSFYLKDYLEGILVILLFQIGEFLSSLAISNSKKSITKLMDFRVEKIELEDQSTIPVEKAKMGDIFTVRPGDRIPLDGVIVKGTSTLDTSSITGESTPTNVGIGDSVFSGCVNEESILQIKATSTYQTSTAQRVIELIEEEEKKKSSTETWIHSFAKVYTPVIVIIGALILIIPFFLGYDVNTWLYRTLIFIVSSCPCALVISVPLGYFCGIGASSKQGILVKGAKELENLSKIDTILLDKTGTITEGKMKLSKVETNIPKKEFLKILLSVEENSNHPIAQAIKKEIKEKPLKVTSYKELAGYGVSCKIGKEKIVIGNEKLMEKEKINIPEIKELGTIIYVGRENKYIGYVTIEDKIKSTSKNWSNKKETIILSGDKEEVVEEVAKELKIKKYYGNLLPTDKVKIMEEYQKKGRVLFIGDGINDALVLSKADVGVSLGNIGTDAALEASDVVLMNGDITKIEDAMELSKYTEKKVKQSIIFALTVKIIVLILSIFGKSTMLLAIFADVGVTLLAILNVLFIFKYQVKKK